MSNGKYHYDSNIGFQFEIVTLSNKTEELTETETRAESKTFAKSAGKRH